MVASVSPNQMIAAGTQATEGSDWSPERIGPIAARTARTLATSSPSGVPITSATRKPSAPRETLCQMTPRIVPLYHSSASASHTISGLGNW